MRIEWIFQILVYDAYTLAEGDKCKRGLIFWEKGVGG